MNAMSAVIAMSDCEIASIAAIAIIWGINRGWKKDERGLVREGGSHEGHEVHTKAATRTAKMSAAVAER